MNILVRKIKRLFCNHEFVDDYVFYKTEFKYITGFASVYKCRKCGKVIIKSNMEQTCGRLMGNHQNIFDEREPQS